MAASRVKASALILLLLFAGGAFALWSGGRRPYQTTAFLMDTFIEIRFYGWRAQAAADRLIDRLGVLETAISPAMEGSDLVALSKAAGTKQPVPVREDTFRLLKKARDYSLASDGTFDLTIAPLVRLWGVTSDNPRVPSPDEIRDARALTDARDLILDEAQGTALLQRSGQGVDLGGIAKGAAADLVYSVMDDFQIKNGYVSLGGNMVVRGVHPDTGKDFLFGVRDPRGDAGAYIGTLKLKGMTMATTGDYERFFIENGERYHHVLDPRTGSPADGGWISVSVISRDGALADFLSTALFVAGKDKVLSSCMEDARYAVVAVDSQGQVYLSPGLRSVFEPNPEKTGYRFQYVAESGGGAAG